MDTFMRIMELLTMKWTCTSNSDGGAKKGVQTSDGSTLLAQHNTYNTYRKAPLRWVSGRQVVKRDMDETDFTSYSVVGS
jgi:hypothetical protein